MNANHIRPSSSPGAGARASVHGVVRGLPLAAVLALAASLAVAQETEPVRASVAAEIVGEEGVEAAELQRDDSVPVGEAHKFDAVFRDHLYKNDVLMLRGIQAIESVTFPLPQNWELQEDPELHLFVEHSEALLGDRSSMTVLVNDKAVTSVFLDEKNVTNGEVVAKLPREFLTDYNRVTIMVVQHYTRDCEDPFDFSLWTRVDNRSFISFDYKRQAIDADLSKFPLPFYDERGIGKVPLTLVGPDAMAPEAVEALGPVSMAFGRMADYRGVQLERSVGSLSEAKTNAIAIGLPASNPVINELIGGQKLGASEGLVAVVPNPSDPTLGVLVITGGGPEGLMKAAWAVGGRNRGEVLSGPRSIVTSVEPSVPPSKKAPLSAPASTNFTLADLRFEDKTVRGFYAPPISIPLMLEGDAQVREGYANLELEYGYSAQLDTRISTIEVQIDGVSIQSQALSAENGEDRVKLRVALPAENLKPHTEVTVLFHLFPKQFDACERVSDRIIWGTVYATSRFDIARDHWAEMPDLGRLRYNLWPFTTAKNGPVTVLVPDAPKRDDAAAAFLAGVTVGRLREETVPAFRISTSQRAAGGSVPDENLILLVADAPHGAYKALKDANAMAVADGAALGELTRRSLTGSDGKLVEAAVSNNYGMVEEFQLPAPNPAGHSVLVLRTPTSGELPELVSRVSEPATLRELDKNVAVVPPEGDVKSVRAGNTVRVGTMPPMRIVRSLSAMSWPAIMGGIIVLSIFLALVTSLWARRRGGRT